MGGGATTFVFFKINFMYITNFEIFPIRQLELKCLNITTEAATGRQQTMLVHPGTEQT